MPGWSMSAGGRNDVEQAILVESWSLEYERLGFDPSEADPPFLAVAVAELGKSDG
jgi:hypothetical protein